MDTAADSLTTAATLFAGPGLTNTTPSTNVREFIISFHFITCSGRRLT